MSDIFEKTKRLIGVDGFKRLSQACVLVVGLGGVGGAATEVLARTGVGRFVLVDGDVFEHSNLNRQIVSSQSLIGACKAQATRERILSINPSANVSALNIYFDDVGKNAIFPDDVHYDYCIDAIDDIDNKVKLIAECKRRGIPMISAMGAGNRLDCNFAVTDIYKTEYDPFAKIMRRKLKDAGITSLDTVCATTPPAIKLAAPSSVAAPPFVMGAIMANHAICAMVGVS